MKVSRYILFLFIWTTVVYDIVAHWVWSSATLLDDNGNPFTSLGWVKGLGALDFAGGTVVHVTSGMSALVASTIVGKRRVWNRETGQIVSPHNVPMLLTGTAILWFGWFGFNGGSALSSGQLATVAFTNTMITPLISMFTWIVLESMYNKLDSFTATGAATGAVVGLVGITPAAGFISPIMGIPMGIITAAACFGALQLKRRIFIADDTLDVFTCHGIGGATGSILLGFFATTEVNPAGANGVFYGNPILLAYQLAAVFSVAAISICFTAVILLSMKYTIGLRSDDIEKELIGMDLLAHQEIAYNFDKLQVVKSSPKNSSKSPDSTNIELGESEK